MGHALLVALVCQKFVSASTNEDMESGNQVSLCIYLAFIVLIVYCTMHVHVHVLYLVLPSVVEIISICDHVTTVVILNGEFS